MSENNSMKRSEAHRQVEWELILEMARLGIIPKTTTPEDADKLYPKVTQLVAHMRPRFVELETAEAYMEAGRRFLEAPDA